MFIRSIYSLAFYITSYTGLIPDQEVPCQWVAWHSKLSELYNPNTYVTFEATNSRQFAEKLLPYLPHLNYNEAKCVHKTLLSEEPPTDYFCPDDPSEPWIDSRSKRKIVALILAPPLLIKGTHHKIYVQKAIQGYNGSGPNPTNFHITASHTKNSFTGYDVCEIDFKTKADIYVQRNWSNLLRSPIPNLKGDLYNFVNIYECAPSMQINWPNLKGDLYNFPNTYKHTYSTSFRQQILQTIGGLCRTNDSNFLDDVNSLDEPVSEFYTKRNYELLTHSRPLQAELGCKVKYTVCAKHESILNGTCNKCRTDSHIRGPIGYISRQLAGYYNPTNNHSTNKVNDIR